MNETLGRMGVQITVDNKQAVTGFKQVSKSAANMSKETKARLASFERSVKQAESVVDNARKAATNATTGAGRELHAIQSEMGKVEKSIQSLRKMAGKKQESAYYKQLKQELAMEEKLLAKAGVARDKAKAKWDAAGGTTASTWTDKNISARKAYEEALSEYNGLRKELVRLQNEMARVEKEGSHLVETDESRQAVVRLKNEEAKLANLQKTAGERARQSKEEQKAATKRLIAAERELAYANHLAKNARKWANFESRVRRVAKSVKNAAVGIVGWTKKIANGFGKVYQRIPLLNSLPKTLKKVKRGLMMGAGVRGLIRLGVAGFGVYKALSMMREGMTNLAQYSGQTNSDISMLKSSLATLKNALATAFAPIFTAIAPAINYLLELLIKAATAVAHFTAAFTGKSTVVVAKKQTVDYAGSLNDAAGAADSANDAAKEYQKTLLGFDQMEILNDASNGSGSGGSGGGAGGAGGGVGDMFETVEVSDEAGDLAQKIKDAWAKADFSEFGIILADKLNDALSKIPWDYIQGLAKKGALSITSFLNAFIVEADWKLVGKTIAEGFNTAFTFFGTLVSTFDFKAAGDAVGNLLSGVIENVRWNEIGSTIGNLILGGINFVSTAVSTTNWNALGKGIVDGLANVPWFDILTGSVQLVGNITNGLFGLLNGALDNAIERLSGWISSGRIWDDLFDFGTAVLNVSLNFLDEGKDLVAKMIAGSWKLSLDVIVSLTKEDGAISKISNWVLDKIGFKLSGDNDGTQYGSGKPSGLPPSVTGGHGIGEQNYTPDTRAYATIGGIGGNGSKTGRLVYFNGAWVPIESARGGASSGGGGGSWSDTKPATSRKQAGAYIGTNDIMGVLLPFVTGKWPVMIPSIWRTVDKLFTVNKDNGKIEKRKTSYVDEIKKSLAKFDKNVQKAGKEGKLNASVIGAFGKNPFDKGALFGSLGSLSAQAKIKTTAELVGIKDKIPTDKKSVGNMLAMLSRKNETFNKTTGKMTASLGSKLEGFSHTSNNMTASLGNKLEEFSHTSNNMTASLGSKSEGFSHWTDKMSAWITGKSEGFDHWTDKMSAWLKYKGEYFDHWTDAMTAYINSISFGSRAKQIILSATTKASGGLYRNGRWQPITAAASGGSFNTGQMFIAREAGPELVGRIGSGTSVMNNDQIVASVSAGVAQGAYQAFVSAFSDTGGLQTNVVLQGDAAKFFRAMQQQAIMYMNSTGQSPFPM